MRIHAVIFLVLAAACGGGPEHRYPTAVAHGYRHVEELHEAVVDVTPLDQGTWTIQFARSARNYRISRAMSPDAADLVARARLARQTGTPVHATILVHDAAPRTRSPAGEASGPAPYPWLVVRIGFEPVDAEPVDVAPEFGGR